MPRLYRIPFEQVLAGQPQDLVTLLLPTSVANFKAIDIVRYWVCATDVAVPSPQMMALRLRFLPATVTPGSGGATPTPTPLDPGDSAAKCTAHTNDTSKSGTNGTAVTLDEQSCYVNTGFDSASEGQEPIPIPCNNTLQQAVVFELLNAPSGTVHLSGGLDYVERG